MWGFEITIILAMICVNSIFAGYEIALASVGLGRLLRLAEEHRGGAKAALYMKQNVEASLAVVQLGITLVGAIAAAVGGAGAEEKLAPTLMSLWGLSEEMAELLSIALVVAPLTVVTIIVGELIPKVFALRNPEWVCLTLSPYMRWFSFSVWPAVWMFETVVMGIMSWGERRMGPDRARSETAELQDLRATASLARATRLIGHREERIILGATELQTRRVSEIMIPVEHMSTLDANAPLPDNLVAAHLDMHTRFPVVDRKDDPQSVIGYVNFKDIVAALRLNPRDPSFRAIVRPIPSFTESQPIAECLERLMRTHTHIALVRSAGERIVGLVSLEDIIEVLVGDIEDEYDKLPAHIVRSGASWVVGGGVSLARLKDMTGIDLAACPPVGDARRVCEWVEGHLGREVLGGEIIEQGPVRLVVRKIRRKKVQEAQITLSETPPPQETAAHDTSQAKHDARHS